MLFIMVPDIIDAHQSPPWRFSLPGREIAVHSEARPVMNLDSFIPFTPRVCTKNIQSGIL